MTYYIAATQANGYVLNTALWIETKATTLAAAKRAATARRPALGMDAWVGVKRADGYVLAVAVRRVELPGPACWCDLDEGED